MYVYVIVNGDNSLKTHLVCNERSELIGVVGLFGQKSDFARCSLQQLDRYPAPKHVVLSSGSGYHASACNQLLSPVLLGLK